MAIRCQSPFHDFTGRLSLTQSAAVVARAHLLIGVDTGLTHMGLAFECPTVAIFGSTRPYLISANHRLQVLYEPMTCSPCRRHPTCDGAFHCMAAIGIHQVIHAASTAMEGVAL